MRRNASFTKRKTRWLKTDLVQAENKFMAYFYTAVISLDPRFNNPGRIIDILLLEPVTRQLVNKIIEDAKAHGVELMVFETYRSQARQQQLFDLGQTKLRQVGVHHYGLACDIVYNVNGEPSWKGDFSLIGHLSLANGLVWGGDWGNPAIHHSFIDADHVQRCTIARQAALFTRQWYPDDSYNPYKDK